MNECTLQTDMCSHNCHNTEGSYTCSCRTGYMLNSDGFTCDGEYNMHTLEISRPDNNVGCVIS